MSGLLHTAHNVLQSGYGQSKELAKRWVVHRQRKVFQSAITNFKPPYKLHLGCGYHRLPDWVNVDFMRTPAVDIEWNVMYDMPLPDASCELIFHEHLLEHFSVDQGLIILRQCHRLLQPGGVLRIAMPSLDHILNDCHTGGWQTQKIAHVPKVHTKSEYLNVMFRWWGHQWIYDNEELYRRLTEAGFKTLRDAVWHDSGNDALKDLEHRDDSLLICEAVKD